VRANRKSPSTRRPPDSKHETVQSPGNNVIFAIRLSGEEPGAAGQVFSAITKGVAQTRSWLAGIYVRECTERKDSILKFTKSKDTKQILSLKGIYKL